LAMADLVAPSLAIGLAFGRIGCLMNGCCYGGQTDHAWAVTFPKYSSRYDAGPDQAVRRYSPPYSDQAARGEMLGMRIDSRGEKPPVVTRVEPNSRAAAAGLKAGDAIVAINGYAIDSLDDAKLHVLGSLESQRAMRVKLSDGRTVDVAPVTMPARSLPVHPTQIYSAIDAGILGWLLWSFYPFRRRDGEAIALLLTIHPITRFLLEIIRTDEPAVFGTGMSISQNISLVLLACGAALWWHLSRQPRGVIWPLARPAVPPKRAVPSGASVRAGRS